MMVEKVTGIPLAGALHTDLIDPAGLHRTWVQTADAPTAPLTVDVDVARWGYLLYGGQVIDSRLVTAMEADPQHETSLDMDYALGTMVATDNGQVILGRGGGSTRSPYTSVLLVWTEVAMAVSVLVPQPARGADDYARFELAFQLHSLVG